MTLTFTNMKRTLIAVLLASFLSISARAQYTQLVPTLKSIPNAAPNNRFPSYVEAFALLQDGLIAIANSICEKELTNQVKVKVEAARSAVKKKTTYMVIADYTIKTDCKITYFEPLNGSPAAIASPDIKLLVYTIDIYPWIVFDNKKW